jgi:phosphoglycerate kinase
MVLRLLSKLDKRSLKDKIVLVRFDFNVPVNGSGKISDNKRIRSALPTLQFLLEHEVKQVVMISHMGRPGGKPKNSLKLDLVAKELTRLVKQEGVYPRKVKKLDDVLPRKIPSDSKLVLLENVRFLPGEEANDKAFAKKIVEVSKASVFVNDAFAVCHRKHASVHAITALLPSYAGLLLEQEVNVIEKVIKKPGHPYVAVLGGKKLKTKIPMIKHVLAKADKLLVGGAMIFTFYQAKGLSIGNSTHVEEEVLLAKELLKHKNAKKIILPTDVIVAKEATENARITIAKHTRIPDTWMGLDIGPETLENYEEILKKAKTVVWNGPMGVFEVKKFAKGTNEIARLLARISEHHRINNEKKKGKENKKGKEKGITTIVGGGDSVSAIEKLGLQEYFTHVSTGGGAFLEMVAGDKLPGVEVLQEKKKKKK